MAEGQREDSFNGQMSFLQHLFQRIVIVHYQKSERAGARKEKMANLPIVIISVGKNFNDQILVHDFTNLEPRSRLSRLLKLHL